MPLQIRQDSESERLASGLVLAPGELFYCQDSKLWYAGDGTTPGGVPLSDQLAGFAVNHGMVRSVAISTAAATSGVVTIGCDGNHGLTAGKDVLIVGATGLTELNGTHAVTGTPAADEFTIALAVPNQSATAEDGIVHCVDAAPADRSAVLFNAAESRWDVRPLATADIADIDSTAATDGQALIFDSGTGKYAPTDVVLTSAVTVGEIGEATPPTNGSVGDLWARADGTALFFCTDSGPPAAWERLVFESEI